MKTLLRFIQRQEWSPFRHRRSKENSCSLAQAFYRVAFGRSADPEGLANYVERLQAGLSLENFACELVGSDEFKDRFGPNPVINSDLLHGMYRNAFGRPPDADGFEWWLAQGKRGSAPDRVLAALGSSCQVLERFKAPIPDPSTDFSLIIRALYRTAFGRPPEKSDLAIATKFLQSTLSLDVLAEDIVRSEEFQDRHGSDEDLNRTIIADLYLDGLARRPDLVGLTYWLARAEEGATRANLLASIARSPEAADQLLWELQGSPARYERWICKNDSLSDGDRAAISKHIAALSDQPRFSIVLPANSAPPLLQKTIDSIKGQLYPRWELIIATLQGSEISAGLDQSFEQGETRIKRLELAPLEDHATAANQSLRETTGDFVVFIRAGDRLPEQALYEVAVALNEKPDSDIIYTDSDSIDHDGKRSDPLFKPSYDPDLLLSHNYIGDLVAYRRTLLDKLGVLRPQFGEATFYDLILRASAEATPGHINHIPAILYHRHIAPDRTEPESATESKGATALSNFTAVREYLDRQGLNGALIEPAPLLPGHFRIRFPVPEPEPMVSIIIPSRDHSDLLDEAVQGILHRTAYRNLEVLIVDNDSREPTALDLLDRLGKQESRVRILARPGPFNYSALNNAAAKVALGEILILLNNDTKIIDAGWLREMVSQAIRPEVGVVGARLLYENGTVQHGGIMLGPKGAVVHIHRFAKRTDPGYLGQLALTRSLSALTGACLAIKTNLYIEAGGLDQVNLPVTFNDVDLCLRIQAKGYRIVWTPYAEMLHLESISRGVDRADPEKYRRALSEWRFLRRAWGKFLEQGDRFHNPNIRFHWDACEIPAPPRRARPSESWSTRFMDRQSDFQGDIVRFDFSDEWEMNR